MVSSSSFKKSHKPTMSLNSLTKKKTMSLNSLPDDLLVEISSCVGASSFFHILHLQLVSKSFQRFCNDRYVLHRLSLRKLPFFPWNHNREIFYNFFKRCRKNGNPEAFYRKGLIDFFYQDQENREQERKGLKRLAKASEKGNQEAQYAYGMILLCRGGKTKQKGFEILSSLIKPLMSTTIKKLKKLRRYTRDCIWWRGTLVMRQLRGSYVRDNCKCDGKTKTFLVNNNSVWNGYGKTNDMITSYACENCLWDYEVQLFFKNL